MDVGGMDIETTEKIEYLCLINKNDHAVAVYISQFMNDYNDFYSYELYKKLLEFRINYVPHSILHEVFSMELYLLYHRFGETAIDSYCYEYNTNNFTRELSYIVVASEEYAQYILSLITIKTDDIDTLNNLLHRVL